MMFLWALAVASISPTRSCCLVLPSSIQRVSKHASHLSAKQHIAKTEGMVLIHKCAFWMGTDRPNLPDAGPIHKVSLPSFYIDKTLVTNDQFSAFVRATGYVTVAERKLDPNQFPGVPSEKLKPGSVVFNPPKAAVPLDNPLGWWSFIPGANWRHPNGPASSMVGKGNFPVVQVAW